MIATPRLILVDNGLPIAVPAFNADPDDTLAGHTALLRAFLASAGARRRARRARTTQATSSVACVSFRHGPDARANGSPDVRRCSG